LKRPDQYVLVDILEAEEGLYIDIEDIRVEEARAAISKPKRRKAPGERMSIGAEGERDGNIMYLYVSIHPQMREIYFHGLVFHFHILSSWQPIFKHRIYS
jgi:hypothetical protein